VFAAALRRGTGVSGGEAAAADERSTKEARMSRLIRLDGSGHTTLAEWTSEDPEGQRQAIKAFEQERENGMIASVTLPGGEAEIVRELPLASELVVMRRQISGG
jgi:hypothetical protein